MSITYRLKPCDGLGNAGVTLDGGVPVIAYDPAMIGRANTPDWWRAVFLLSHELGHLLDGNAPYARSDSEKREVELQADRFAGFAMRKMGCRTVAQAQAPIQQEYDRPGSSHPTMAERLEAIRRGFNGQLN